MSTRRYAKNRKQNTELIKDAATREAVESLNRRIKALESNLDEPKVVFGDLSTAGSLNGGNVNDWEDDKLILRVSIKSTATPILLMVLHTELESQVWNDFFISSTPNGSNLIFNRWSFIRENDGVKVGGGQLTGRIMNGGLSFLWPANLMTGVDRKPPAGEVKYRFEIDNGTVGNTFTQGISLMAARLG